MLISLNWIRDFVDLPADLDPVELGERFTRTTAEVEEIIPIDTAAKGLLAAKILNVQALPDTHVRLVTLDLGNGKSVETVSAAAMLHVGDNVVYAPPGASVNAIGEVGSAHVAGTTSHGMILPGETLGIAMAVQEAIFPDNSYSPGQELDPALFNDWLIEVDNKSITHRPDLWGHYGIAREVAAICNAELKPYPVVPREKLSTAADDEIPITIADGNACRRYSGLRLEGVPTLHAPLWMQMRLGHVGMRPISGLVDLTNYIMAELGQPMHAFDAAKVTQIEVDWAKEGEGFTTLDGVERKLSTSTLMIQCERQSIALAGVMGGFDTEVSDTTSSLLLESANFDPATIRRAAIALGLRTDASARFEKSLDPHNTVLAIQRFIALARPMYPDLIITSKLSDSFPNPYPPVSASVNPKHVARTVGKDVSAQEAADILHPLGFTVTADDSARSWHVDVPTYRATTDVTIEEDVIEELARCIGYGTIEPKMPQVTVRDFEPNHLHELEQQTLRYFTTAERFVEIHGYLWYQNSWLAELGFAPGDCVELRNAAAEGQEKLRRTLLPGMLSAVQKNRFYFPAFSLIEVGSTFDKAAQGDQEYRHLGVVKARRGKKVDDELLAGLKGSIERWAWQRFHRPVTFEPIDADAGRPWEQPTHTAAIRIADAVIGRISALDAALRRKMDEHLTAWAVVWAELRLDGLADLEPVTEQLGTIPPFPLVDMDFSLLVPKSSRYNDIAKQLAGFNHDLLKSLSFVGVYEGKSIADDQRSVTVRALLGHDERTLVDDDTNAFRSAFEGHIAAAGYGMR